MQIITKIRIKSNWILKWFPRNMKNSSPFCYHPPIHSMLCYIPGVHLHLRSTCHKWLKVKSFCHIFLTVQTFRHKWLTVKSFWHKCLTDKSFWHKCLTDKSFWHKWLTVKTFCHCYSVEAAGCSRLSTTSELSRLGLHFGGRRLVYFLFVLDLHSRPLPLWLQFLPLPFAHFLVIRATFTATFTFSITVIPL